MRRGFTLIEVMVAVAILGLGLASLFTSQVGAIKIAQRARATTVATLLARCKMAEIEERILIDGLPYDDLNEHDDCCEDLERNGFECEWSVKRIVLPDQITEGDEEGLLDALGGGGDEPEPLADPSQLDPDKVEEEDLSGVLSGTGQGTGSMLDMATQMTFPVIKPIIEEQVRRATVTVRWSEGDKTHSFDVNQFIVSEVGAPQPPVDDDEENGNATGSTGGNDVAGGNAPEGSQ